MTSVTSQQCWQHLSRGDSFFVDEDFSSAIDSYTCCLSSDVNESQLSFRFKALSHRSAANLKLKFMDKALKDAKDALDLYEKDLNVTNLELEQCYARFGISLFESERKSEAMSAFKNAKETALLEGKTIDKYDIWIKKCGGIINNYHVSTKKQSKKSLPSVPKYQYYQNDKIMTIAILEVGVKPENLKVEFSLDKLSVILKKDGVDLTIIYGTLFDAIDVSQCKVKIMQEKVLIKLRKKNSYNWNDLFGNGAKEEDEKSDEDESIPKTKEIPLIDPSKARPYSSQRDWDAIGKDLHKQEEKEKPEGDEALNKLFQQIYGKANDDTRRAMSKSFQTSGGTVLSTNWDEVSKTDYEKEKQAPKGMEWKNWEGDRLPQKDNNNDKK